jgi:hypothetical protein
METKTDSRSIATAELMDRFNEVFLLHDPVPLRDMIAEDCVIEKINAARMAIAASDAMPVSRFGPRSRPRQARILTSKRLSRWATARSFDGVLEQRHNLDTRRKPDAGA